MKKFFLLILIIWLVIASNESFGQSKSGSSAATFLTIGVGARAIGMGEAYVAASNDALSLYWNPGGLTSSRDINVIATHTEWFAGLSHEFTGISVPIGEGAIGASLTFLTSDEIEITTIEEPEGTGLYFDATDLAIGISYAHRLLTQFSVGVTGKYIQQKLYNETASGFALDIGTILTTSFYGLKIGMALLNFGGMMKMDGPDLIVPHNSGGDIAITPDIEAKMSTQEWPLPMTFRVGIALDVLGKPGNSVINSESSRLTLAVDGSHPTDNAERGNFGLEYSWRNSVALRTGYKYNYSEQGMTFGGGINYGLVENVLLSIDYAWSEFGDLGYVHRFSLGFTF